MSKYYKIPLAVVIPSGESPPPVNIDLGKLEELSQDIIDSLGSLSLIVTDIDEAQDVNTEGIKQKLTEIKDSAELSHDKLVGDMKVGFTSVNAAANAINSAVTALDSNTSALLKELKTVGVDTLDKLNEQVNFSDKTLQELVKANQELAGVKTSVLALKAEHDETQAKQDLQRQVSEETNRLLGPKNVMHKSVVVDFSTPKKVTITQGTTYYLIAQPVQDLNSSDDRSDANGRKVIDEAWLKSEVFTVDDRDNPKYNVPPNFVWTLGEKDGSVLINGEDKTFESLAALPQKYSFEVYFDRSNPGEIKVDDVEEEPLSDPGVPSP